MLESEHVRDWIFEYHALDATAADLHEFAAFKAMWDEKRVDGRLPAWRDFELQDFAPWWGWIIVEDVIRDPDFDTRYRLWGVNVATFYGVDFTGKRVTELDTPIMWPEDLAFNERLAHERLIGLCRGPMQWNERKYKDYAYMLLPLADDGETVDRLITLIHPGERSKGW